jgi:hypothetical protein
LIVFGTISTSSHLYKCFALANSVSPFGGILKILLIDQPKPNQRNNLPPNCELVMLDTLQSDIALKLANKYKKDKLRWSLKPVFLLYLLTSFQKAIYVDNDIFFFSDYNGLEKELDNNNILLTPHYYPSSPKKNQTWLEANLRIGLFNAGFVGANRNAKEALEWWSECCLYEMKKSYSRGLFDDQKYLDLMPILFDKVKILKNKACNVAGWNDHIQIPEKEVIFVHFNSFTLNKFKDETHKYVNLCAKYKEEVRAFNPNFEFKSTRLNSFEVQNALYFIKWRIVRLFN